MIRVSAEWLARREPADHAARATSLADAVAALLANQAESPTGAPVVIHDLGCGTGSMSRWLAPRLPGRQQWILTDLDPDLLALAAAGPNAGTLVSADGYPVTALTRLGDVTAMTVADLAGASLVTTSALLDLLTEDEVRRLAAACAGARCPALFTLSVLGHATLSPDDPLDAEIMSAFNAHQRRVTPTGRRLLGPDAVTVTAEAFARTGATVRVRASPWVLSANPAADPAADSAADPAADPAADSAGDPAGDPAAGQGGLIGDWLTGWVGAAVEQWPELAEPAEAYLRRRRTDLALGRLSVVVDHGDLLAEYR